MKSCLCLLRSVGSFAFEFVVYLSTMNNRSFLIMTLEYQLILTHLNNSINTVQEPISQVTDALHDNLKDVLIKVAVQDGVCAGGGQTNQVTDHVRCHHTL